MAAIIQTAETKWYHLRENLASQGVFIHSERMAELGLHWAAKNPATPARLMVPAEVAEALPLHAYVNDGRWIVQCECRSAQYAARSDHRFFCPDCLNVGSHGRWRPVVWPDDATVARIEANLIARPPEHRHWPVDRAVDDLAAENKTHGLVYA